MSVETVDGRSVEINRDMWLVREFDRTDPAEENNPAFVVERDGQTVVDDFSDEIALVIRESGSLLVFVGCSHPGIVNMISTVRNRFTEPIRAVIGGFHLLHETPERVEAVGRFFQDLDLQMFGACHCTGTEAMQILKGMIPGYFDNMSGTEVRFP